MSLYISMGVLHGKGLVSFSLLGSLMVWLDQEY